MIFLLHIYFAAEKNIIKKMLFYTLAIVLYIWVGPLFGIETHKIVSI